MNLAKWLKTQNKTKAEFSTELGLQVNAVSRYISGKRMPRRETLKKITEITKGKVTASDFISKDD